MLYAEIALPIPLHQTFTYEVPPNLNLSPLTRVLVPFSRRKRVGIVLSVHSNQPNIPIKKVEQVLDETPFLHPLLWEWLEWGSRYYLTPVGETLLTALPNILFKPHSQKKIYQLKTRSSPLKDHWSDPKKVTLSETQDKIVQALIQAHRAKQFHPALLHGVTGSGKTEIYLHLIEEVMRTGKQVIFLVPEIGLTPQITARFQARFKERLSLYHSGLTDNQRLAEWLRAKDGEAQVTVGTRSALFAPYANLGAIILDEEQDSSYKQEDRFRYHARDLAMVRGRMQNSIVLLGSATPSLESFWNAKEGKYRYYHLPERPTGVHLPDIRLVDLAAQKRQSGSPLALCRELHDAILTTLKKGEQTLILMNRRGFARSFLCLACQKVEACPNCSVNLIYHKNGKSLKCHYCDLTRPLPKTCPACGSTEVTLLGLGTETIEEELKSFFPKARIARLDRDSTQKKGSLLQLLEAVRKREIDILVGTQMIAKGHDLPFVTLVGVVGIDAGLGLPDFRAAERTFQLLMQVAGRAGRANLKGQVIVQSYAPQQDSVQFACRQDFEGFYRVETVNRKELGYPPCGRLIQFVFSSASEQNLQRFTDALESRLHDEKRAPALNTVQLLGPSPAPLEKIRGRYRWQLLLKGREVTKLKSAAHEVIQILGSLKPGAVKWAVDVDPLGML